MQDQSPISKTPEFKKVRTPEKSKASSTPEKSDDVGLFQPIELPAHYKRFVDDLRILDEALSIFRVKNQVPYFSLLKENIERASGRRFTLDHFRQLMTATSGSLFRAEWQPVRDQQGKVLKYDVTVRAIDHEKDGTEIFKRLTSEQIQARKSLVICFLQKKLEEYVTKAGEGAKIENAYPIKPFDLPLAPGVDGVESGRDTPSTPASGRARVLAKCDSVASDGSAVKTPKTSLRRQLSVSASPVMPNILPQFVSTTPVKLTPFKSEPMSAKEKLEAIRNRVKAREENDVEEAKAYDAEMDRKAKLDEFDFAIKLLIKLNHKFPIGIDTAKMSTLKKDYGAMFVNAEDVDKWSKKICDLVPHRFELRTIGEETVLQYKTTDVKISVVKKEIEDLKTAFAAIIRE